MGKIRKLENWIKLENMETEEKDYRRENGKMD